MPYEPRDQTTSARSLWLDTAAGSTYPPLAESPLSGGTVDVAIIGGGITGLTTALFLQRLGLRVAVLEADRVASGVTGCTTAKVSALQSTVYTSVQKARGSAVASAYATASRAAVEMIAGIAIDEGIECDVERRDAYTVAERQSQRRSVEREFHAARDAGLPVDTVDDVDLPYETFGAVRLRDQLQLHPVRYVQGLAAAVHRAAPAVFEQTRVLSVEEGTPCTVRTSAGTLRADHVVVATHYPILDRGGYFARLTPQRSYCIAVRLGSGTPPAGMSISAGSPTHSVRSYGDLLILGGEGHSAGARSATPERFERLAAFAAEHWDVAAVTHRWSAQDPSHYDETPVIGPYRPGSTRLWVAAGFMKWGLTSGTFAARILADRITGADNPWADAFTPSRVSVRSLPSVAELGAKFSADFVADRLRPPHPGGAAGIPAGEARVVADGLGRKGVYRDPDGSLHAVSVRCTHMGCLLRFNGAEKSWDCPCHGSRFDVDGHVLEGPAVRDLEQRPTD